METDSSEELLQPRCSVNKADYGSRGDRVHRFENVHMPASRIRASNHSLVLQAGRYGLKRYVNTSSQEDN